VSEESRVCQNVSESDDVVVSYNSSSTIQR
jgi:hypothetical protein